MSTYLKKYIRNLFENSGKGQMGQRLLGATAAPRALVPSSRAAEGACKPTCSSSKMRISSRSSLLAATKTPSQIQAASSPLCFSKQCFPNQIYIFKNPSDNHKPKKLPLRWGLIRRKLSFWYFREPCSKFLRGEERFTQDEREQAEPVNSFPLRPPSSLVTKRKPRCRSLQSHCECAPYH